MHLSERLPKSPMGDDGDEALAPCRRGRVCRHAHPSDCPRPGCRRSEAAAVGETARCRAARRRCRDAPHQVGQCSRLMTETADQRKKTSDYRTTGTTAQEAPRPHRRRDRKRPDKAVPRPHVQCFVGTGPGDASLLTVRAAELLAPGRRRRSPSCPSRPRSSHVDDAEIVDGGVGEDGEPLTHAARARLVVKHAKTGAHVVRLIAGDPFTYATGPEEAAACAKAGIGFEIVPGVSSVSAVAGLRRRAADQPHRPRVRGRQRRRRQDRLVRARRPTRRSSCSRRSAGSARSPTALSPPAVPPTRRSR